MRSRVVVGLSLSAVVLAIGWTVMRRTDAGSGAAEDPGRTTAAAGATVSSAPAPAAVPVGSVSFDDEATRVACSLLTRPAIDEAFAPAFPEGLAPEAGRPVPLDPTCQWRLGADGFVALAFDPERPWAELADRAGNLEEEAVGDLGAGAFWATTKALYFGSDTGSGWIEYQRTGQWSDEYREPLLALARAALAAAPGQPVDPPALRCAPGCDRAALAQPRVWMGGDSMMGGIAFLARDAIREAAEARGAAEPEVLSEQQVSSGIARADFFDWPRHLEAVAAYLDPDAVVFLAGANDGQSIDAPDGSVPYGTPEWDAAYRERVDRVIDAVAENGRTLLWVGEPVARDPDLDARFARIDAIVKAAVAGRTGVAYLDLRTELAPPGSPGVYTDHLLLPQGTTLMRNDDGVHLSVEGSRYVAGLIAEALGTLGVLPPAPEPIVVGAAAPPAD